MRKQTMLPMEFSSLQSKINYIQQWSKDEWSSSCPQCGGQPHQDGEYPDRFRMWTNASGKNKIMGWCRHCSYIWLPNKDSSPSPEEFEKWRREQIERETRRKEEAERAIALLKRETIWEKYNQELDKCELSIETMKSWGIPRNYAAYWKLGFIADYTVYNKKDGEYHSPAISIPIWQLGKSTPSNVKVRVLNPKCHGDRYRQLYKTGSAKPFVAFRNIKTDSCLVVEGEKKSMVSGYKMRQAKIDFQAIGMPSKTPDEECISVLEPYKTIYLCLDPDAKIVEKNGVSPLKRMIDLIGRKRVRLINLPGKIDDMINQNNLDIVDVLRYSQRLEDK